MNKGELYSYECYENGLKTDPNQPFYEKKNIFVSQINNFFFGYLFIYKLYKSRWIFKNN